MPFEELKFLTQLPVKQESGTPMDAKPGPVMLLVWVLSPGIAVI